MNSPHQRMQSIGVLFFPANEHLRNRVVEQQGGFMPVDGEHTSLGEDIIEAPAEARTIPERRWQPPVEKARQPEPAPEPSAAQEEEPQTPRRHWLRWALF